MKLLYVALALLIINQTGYCQLDGGYRSYFPLTNDAVLKSIINHPNLTYYDKTTIIPMYQHDQKLIRVDDTSINNPNTVRPWRVTVGLDESPDNKVLTFMILPDGKPIVWWKNDDLFTWEYPVGTRFIEVLLVTDPQEVSWACEVRVLTKLTVKSSHWGPRIYRPLETYPELITTLRKHGYQWNVMPTLAKKKLTDSFKLFSAEANFHDLPKFPETLVRDILTKVPFKLCENNPWLENCAAPTTQETFHIVPKGYQGAFLDISRATCTNCHSTTLKHAKEFPAFTKGKIDEKWDGRVRGSDGIFSFHIFNKDGTGLNQKLLDSGKLVERVDYKL